MIRLANELENVKTVAVAGHIRPDGDCTGSCLAVYSYLQENFPEISVDVYLEAVNPNFLFLKGADQVKTSCAEDKKYDLFISLDASGAIELISMRMLPRVIASAIPCGPRTTSLTWGELGSIVITISLPFAASAALSAL